MNALIQRFMRFFYRHFYHGLAWSYDLVAAVVSLGHWRAWGRAGLEYLAGERVLELGFGPGHLQVEMRQRGLETLGLDESWQMIRQARGNLERRALPVALLRGLAQNLPLAGATLDSVLSTFPSEYIADPRTLAEIWRVLRPGGRLVLVPAAWLDGGSLPERVARWLFRVTGQGQDVTDELADRIGAVLGQQSWRVETFRRQIGRSVVLVVVAIKVGAS